EGPSATYNVPLALRLRGALEVAALHAALADVVERHEILRTVFPETDGIPHQRILEDAEARLALGLRKATEETLARELAAESRRGFDLTVQMPLRAFLFTLGTEEHVLLVVMHHIVSDGWS